MIIFYCGLDTYRLREAEKEVRAKYIQKYPSGLALTTHDLSQLGGFESLEDSLKSASFFNEVKLLVVKNSFANVGVAEKLENLCTKFKITDDKEAVLFIVENKSKSEMEKVNKSLVGKLLIKSKPVKEFDFLKGTNLEKWVKDEAAKRKLNLNPRALSLLLAREGNETCHLATILDQLANYAQGKAVSESEVAMFTSENQESNIFSLLDAMFSKEKEKSAALLFQNLASGQDPYYLLTMMAYQVRNLLIVREALDRGWPSATVAAKLGLNPFVVRKASGLVKRLSDSELRQAHGFIQSLDVAAKQGRVDLEDSIYSFILSL